MKLAVGVGDAGAGAGEVQADNAGRGHRGHRVTRHSVSNRVQCGDHTAQLSRISLDEGVAQSELDVAHADHQAPAAPEFAQQRPDM